MIQRLHQKLHACYVHISNDGKNGLALVTILGLGAIGIGLASLGGQNAHKWWSISDTIKKIGENNSIIMMAAGGVSAGIGVIGLLLLKEVKATQSLSVQTSSFLKSSYRSPSSAPAVPSAPVATPVSSSPSLPSSASASPSAPVATPVSSSSSLPSSAPASLPLSSSSNAVVLSTEHLTVDTDFSQQQLEALLSKEIVERLTKMELSHVMWTVFEKNGATYYLVITPVKLASGVCENVIHRVKPTNNSNVAKYSFHMDLCHQREFNNLARWFLSPEDVIFIDNRPVMLTEITTALKNSRQKDNLFVFVQDYKKEYCCIRRCGSEVFMETEKIPNYEISLKTKELESFGSREIKPIQLLATKPTKPPILNGFTYDSTLPLIDDPMPTDFKVYRSRHKRRDDPWRSSAT